MDDTDRESVTDPRNGSVPPEDTGALRVGELPELHMMSLDEVVLHEDPDMERVARLVDRFSADGVLKNPPVVGRSPGHRPIVLDGANRVTSLRKLDYSHVLVQVLDLSDPGLQLERWHHAVEHVLAEELLARAAAVDGVTLVDGERPRMSNPVVLARLRFPRRETVTLLGASELLERVRQLHQITRAYHRFSNFDRVSYSGMEHLVRNYRSFTALVSFPRFDLSELQAITASDRTVPSGITRILLPKRALRFNVQLEILRAGLSLEEKEIWLQQTIQEKVVDKSIRFYREPTFFFDE
jgi:hypothetical protein